MVWELLFFFRMVEESTEKGKKHFVYSEFYFEPVVLGLGGMLSISGFH